MKKKITKKYRLPKEFAGYFWDCDFSKLDINNYKIFILKRLMSVGGKKAIVWILRNFSHSEVRALLKKNVKEIDARSLNFWDKLSRMRTIWN